MKEVPDVGKYKASPRKTEQTSSTMKYVDFGDIETKTMWDWEP